MSLASDLLNGVGGLLSQAGRTSSESSNLLAYLNPLKIVVLLINSSISKNPEFRSKLEIHKGKYICVKFMHKIYYFKIMGSHGLEYIEGNHDHDASVTLTLDNSALSKIPTLIVDGIAIEDLMHSMHIEGEVGLANTLAELLVLLRVSSQAELSNMLGPFIAGTLSEGFRKTKEISNTITNKGFDRAKDFMSKDFHVTLNRNDFLELKFEIQDLENRLDKLSWKLKSKNSVVEGSDTPGVQ
ncbi:ubiquinone biosynthesis accessory factor UbiJ [Taylorella equigenitalis]|uniref:Ubiquinone biosynthesis accessory factor UbiJ n=1 Tax=Taylorella equigenitalis ATCC 35865 TaxID=743973 RepID=A0ABM5N942_9BURK|nr:hypothetical protein [Taylorella equigenitalis]AFN35365.1 hypothetical protein KUI_0264 [Taylorella equigenitalis ATCC 35865]ASY38796.1 hypothetical protein CA604_01305 [Taylorella equigenitalis]ASY40320.1 hypothetical protein CAV20_01150 [Taylorella equigenitalis]VEG30400.1 Uncharacterized protein conserved in bacteria [Taylorella equigenitalis ATCC 35865]